MAKGSSLEVTVRLSPSVFIKTEASDMEGVVAAAAPLQEVANVYSKGCQKCKRNKKPGDNIRFNSRTVEKFTYSELLCNDCGAKLSFGKNSDGNLFARWYEQDPNDPAQALMKDGKKVPLPDGGWLKFNPETKTNY